MEWRFFHGLADPDHKLEANDSLFQFLRDVDVARGQIGSSLSPEMYTLAAKMVPGGVDIVKHTTIKHTEVIKGKPVVKKEVTSETVPGNIRTYLPDILDALSNLDLNDTDMVMMALGTIRAETGSFRPLDEGISKFNTSPKGTQGRHAFDLYDHRTDLGNDHRGDGSLYKGRGSAMAESYSWNTAFLGLTQDSGPNGALATVNYDSFGRASQTTSADGAVTTISYTYAPPTQTVTTNGHWVKTTYDGLGRTIKTEMGDGTGTKSVVDTEYDSCACTPIGKTKRVSQPYTPGGAVSWTTYSYDGLGRTVSVLHADGLSTTAYSYSGSTVTVTDPAGLWKMYTRDAFGNVTKTTEPEHFPIER